ncbi:MAG: NUDIX hydrolase [Parcubacteria group bacterium]
MRSNGANVIVHDVHGRILIVEHRDGEKRLSLPGGEVEEDENFHEAAEREVWEETGLVIHHLHFIAEMVQRIPKSKGGGKGKLHLFETGCFWGEFRTVPSNDILSVQFMSFPEISSRKDEFGLGYLRLILQFMRCKDKLDTMSVYGELSNQVEYGGIKV